MPCLSSWPPVFTSSSEGDGVQVRVAPESKSSPRGGLGAAGGPHARRGAAGARRPTEVRRQHLRAPTRHWSSRCPWCPGPPRRPWADTWRGWRWGSRRWRWPPSDLVRSRRVRLGALRLNGLSGRRLGKLRRELSADFERNSSDRVCPRGWMGLNVCLHGRAAPRVGAPVEGASLPRCRSSFVRYFPARSRNTRGHFSAQFSIFGRAETHVPSHGAGSRCPFPRD